MGEAIFERVDPLVLAGKKKSRSCAATVGVDFGERLRLYESWQKSVQY
jgi:hypothetical protein